MMHGWTKSAVVDLADVSIIETCRRVGFGINGAYTARRYLDLVLIIL
jgi:hypothetical protein